MPDPSSLPILANKDYQSNSVFTPENLLREARRQKSIPEGSVPKICVLDPDGDIVQNLFEAGLAQLNPYWACYHTRMYNFTYEGTEFGIVGNAVGASFAVLVAEEMFACGCELLISMTSAGQIITKGRPPYFVLIEKALRDEAETLPVEDGWADVVISNGVLNLIPDKPAALREMVRVLKPGGRLQIGDILVQKAVPASAKLKIDLWTG